VTIAPPPSARPTGIPSDLAKSYVDKLRARSIGAKFPTVLDAGHLNALASPAILEAIPPLVRR
jgi:hypothetical protein